MQKITGRLSDYLQNKLVAQGFDYHWNGAVHPFTKIPNTLEVLLPIDEITGQLASK